MPPRRRRAYQKRKKPVAKHNGELVGAIVNGATADPEPDKATVDLEPNGATVDPEPNGAMVDPEPGGAMVNSKSKTIYISNDREFQHC